MRYQMSESEHQEPVRVVTVQRAASLIPSAPMSKHFRPWKIDRVQLLPPCEQDLVDANHLARFYHGAGLDAGCDRHAAAGAGDRRHRGRSRHQACAAGGCRQFLLRGVENGRAEWAIVRAAHDLLMLSAELKLAKPA